jgi:hypothetical protein
MKPRHAVAFAMVGWYLLAPPPVPKGELSALERAQAAGTKFLVGAPLSQWAVYDSFDTAAQCREARNDLQSKLSVDGRAVLKQSAEGQ